MLPADVGLLELVEAAYERARRQDWPFPAIEEILWLCRSGLYRDATRAPRAQTDDYQVLLAHHPWTAFLEAVRLAAEIDGFLVILEAEPACRPLARECRERLGLLSVIADWCQDNARPHAATEALRLCGLAAALHQGYYSLDDHADEELDEDDEDDEDESDTADSDWE
jgi:hypothetical protein